MPRGVIGNPPEFGSGNSGSSPAEAANGRQRWAAFVDLRSQKLLHAAVAQLEERPVENRKVAGSIPAGGTTEAPFGYGLVFRSFTAGERVRVPYGVRQRDSGPVAQRV